METLVKFALVVTGSVGVILLLGMLMAYPTMWLWNDLAPSLFGLKVITLWQAWELNILCGWLFRSSTSGSSK